MIKLVNVTKYFGKKCAVKNVNLQVEQGDLFALLGPNGAGKSTILNMITGLISKFRGDITIKGEDIKEKRKVKLPLIGVLFENPSFYNYLSGRDNLLLTARLKGYHDRQKIDSLLSMVSLSSRANDAVGKYSLGMKQRLALACALVGDPKILILDEPTNGLDPEGIHTTLSILKEYVVKKGKTVLMSSHQVYDVESFCNKIAIINEGVILCEGMLDSLLSEDIQSCLVTTDSPEECQRFLVNKPWVKDFKFIKRGKSLKELYIETIEKINR